eukprot:jgi/Tetstr1/466248/TSEL_010804.t1
MSSRAPPPVASSPMSGANSARAALCTWLRRARSGQGWGRVEVTGLPGGQVRVWSQQLAGGWGQRSGMPSSGAGARGGAGTRQRSALHSSAMPAAQPMSNMSSHGPSKPPAPRRSAARSASVDDSWKQKRMLSERQKHEAPHRRRREASACTQQSQSAQRSAARDAPQSASPAPQAAPQESLVEEAAPSAVEATVQQAEPDVLPQSTQQAHLPDPEANGAVTEAAAAERERHPFPLALLRSLSGHRRPTSTDAEPGAGLPREPGTNPMAEPAVALEPECAAAEARPGAGLPAEPPPSEEEAKAARAAVAEASGEAEGEAAGRPVFEGVDYRALEESSELLRNVHVVRDRADAERVAALLMSAKYRQHIFACDTEVAHIDVKKQSPVGHGQVICFSVHAGPHLHFGEGTSLDPANNRNMLWVDTYGIKDEAEVAGVFDAFKPFFADSSIKKVWHNFSFDRHVLNSHGMECNGLAGDTIHMARMFDASRLQGGGSGYSLEALSSDAEIMKRFGKVESKTSMKKLFERPVIKKDGTAGKLTVLAPMEVLQLDPDTRARWIHYSALDAKSTWQLFEALKVHLTAMRCFTNGFTLPAHVSNMWDLYEEYWLPFGQLLTDMEAAGVLVNREHLAKAEVAALNDQEAARTRFKSWVADHVPDGGLMNVSSGPQVRQLFFAGQKNQKSEEHLDLEKTFKIPNDDPNYIEEGAKRWKKNRNITLWGVFGRNVVSPLEVTHYTPSGWPATGTPALRGLAGKSQAALKALAEQGLEEATQAVPLDASFEDDGEGGSAEDGEQEAVVASAAPLSAADAGQLQAEAKKGGLGSMYAAYGGGVAGLRACAAVDALVEVNAIDTLLSNFILPLQGDDIATADHRVHCSLNINTETGRLSARRPNLQNQPALEKDRYKIRKAFTANVAAGHTLVVADYGQLELRLLAHMAQCHSMRQAFELGGDFHSRTALGMYDHIKEAVARGDCLLEWDYPNGEPPPVPLIKDKFASERRKAKVLNFSIAYGKTAHGLMKDFGTDLHEAQETVNRWYADRKEVKEWQERQRELARMNGYVTTLLGRRRKLPGIDDSSAMAKGHAMRAAINTPIQGAAADVATAAMISIDRCQQLKDLGWTLLLQVHDEVILEGPKTTAEEAQRLVVACMERPFNGENPLSVDLNVDSNIADTWYDAK